MMVFTRRVGEEITIPDHFEIVILSVEGDRVEVGVETTPLPKTKAMENVARGQDSKNRKGNIARLLPPPTTQYGERGPRYWSLVAVCNALGLVAPEEDRLIDAGTVQDLAGGISRATLYRHMAMKTTENQKC